MTDPTARIEALEGQGYELDELARWEQYSQFAHDPESQSYKTVAQILTALEQAQAWVEAWRTGTNAALTIGVARLKLAERRNVALRREIDELYANDDLNAEQAEAELSTLKEIENRLRAELAAERAKRCSITSCSEWTARKDEA